VGSFLCEIFDEWIRYDLGRIVIQFFDEALRPACHEPHALCIFRETCGDVVVLEHDGSLYACDHFVDAEHRIGSLHDRSLESLTNDPSLRRFGSAKRDALPCCCKRCDVLAYCNGGCPKDRFLRTTEGELGLSYLCPAYLAFFRHARPALERLAAHWKAGQPLDRFRAGVGTRAKRDKSGPNDPCPCGSGRKFKKCCRG
jgi:uncharacterized protein